MCLARGTATPATVADHLVPHHGDWNAFLLGPLQSLCWSCHSGAKQATEKRGYHSEIDANGWPTDPNHPANRVSQGATKILK